MTNKEVLNDDNFKEAESNWFSFDKVGCSVKGILIGKRKQEGKDGFPDQIVYELEQEDGSIMNVGMSVNKTFVNDRMKRAKMGQAVKLVFTEEIPAKVKGYSPAKSIKVLFGNIAPGYENVDVNDEFSKAKEVPVDDIPFE